MSERRGLSKESWLSILMVGGLLALLVIGLWLNAVLVF
jgi:hypothetical protein